MLKRSILSLVAVLAMSLGGCATVTMVPGTTIVEANVSDEQSALREAALSFGETAEARGWITQSRGFFDLARVLVDGQSSADGADATTYTDFIGAQTRSPDAVARAISVDARDAAAALSEVSQAARDFLAIQIQARDVAARADLMSFERSLVQAQQARRAFAEAVGVSAIIGDETLNTELSRFDAEIDRARSIADELSTEYSQRDVSGAVS